MRDIGRMKKRITDYRLVAPWAQACDVTIVRKDFLSSPYTSCLILSSLLRSTWLLFNGAPRKSNFIVLERRSCPSLHPNARRFVFVELTIIYILRYMQSTTSSPMIYCIPIPDGLRFLTHFLSILLFSFIFICRRSTVNFFM